MKLPEVYKQHNFIAFKVSATIMQNPDHIHGENRSLVNEYEEGTFKVDVVGFGMDTLLTLVWFTILYLLIFI